MAEHKSKFDWRRKVVNEAEKKYTKEEILQKFTMSELFDDFSAPFEILSVECLEPMGGVNPGTVCSNNRKYSAGKEKVPEWYIDDEELPKKFEDIEEEFSKVDVKYEEKNRIELEEDEKMPEWEDPDDNVVEAESEVIVYPQTLVKKYAEEGNPFAGIIISHSTENEGNLVTNPNSIPFEKVWFYKDPQNNTQGPFSTIEMFNWSAAGYFSNNLQIAHSTPYHFFALQMYVLQEKYKLLSNSIGNN